MMKAFVIILMLMLIPVSFSILCKDESNASTPCVVITPALSCSSYTYDLVNITGNSTIISSGPMTRIANTSTYNFTFNQPAGDYLIVLCDNSSLTITSTRIDISVSDLYYRIHDFIISQFSDVNPTNISCIDSSTLRVSYSLSYISTGNSSSLSNYTRYQDFSCSKGCNPATSPPSCNPTSIVNIWVFLILTVISLVLMFFVPSDIVHIIGSFIMMILGGYILISGIDMTSAIGLSGTAASFTLSNQITFLIGLVYIGLSLFRIAVAYSKMKS